jgi:hypothetical protein
MTRHLRLLIAATFLMAFQLPAQEASRAPDGGTSYRVDGVELLGIPNKPLSGKSSIEWTRTLEDGSTVTVHLEANLARDSQGRMYRERRSFVPVNSGQQPRLTEIRLLDPAAKSQANCTVATKQCIVSDYRPRTSFRLMPAGAFANGTRFLAREDLGTNTIEGMNVAGTKETVTVNAGVLGNDRPLASTREFWYSAELETNLAVTRIDPREGKQVVKLVELSRSEPDPRLFEIPDGYSVRDARVQSSPQ